MAQTFTTSADTIEANYDVLDYPSDYIYVVNNSGDSLDLTFDLVTNSMNPTGWTTTLCTQALCMPTIPATAPLGNLADGEQGYLNLHAGFNGITGSGEMSFRVYETSNPSNADTIYFIYHVTSSVGVNEVASEINVTAYPNPASELINIDGLENFTGGQLSLFSVEGKLIHSESISTLSHQINLTSFDSGTYTVLITDAVGNKTSRRFIKN